MKPLNIGGLVPALPLVQGGMGVGVSLGGLAKAVAEQGGIGTISGVQIGFREPDFAQNPVEANLRALAKEIAIAKENPNNIIAINFMVAMRNYDMYVKEAVRLGIDIIVSGAGLPLQLPALVAGSKTKIMPIISSARAATVLLKSWRKHQRMPDAMVLEGPLAGGHLGFKLQEAMDGTYLSLEENLCQVKEAIAPFEAEFGVHIPIIAGGGLHTRADVERILSLGANGVQLGTRFIATEECDAHPNFKNAFLQAKEEDIRIIKSPVGLPARAIQNDFLDRAYTQGIPVDHCFGCMAKCKPTEIPFCISRYLVDVVQGQDGLVFTGANGYRLDKISTVKDVVDDLFR